MAILPGALVQAGKQAAKRTVKRDRTREYARNKARRALNRLEKQVKKQSGRTQEETRQEIKTLRNAIDNSYYNRETKSYTLSTDKLINITRTSRERIEKFEWFLHTDSAAVNRRKTAQMEAYFKSATRTEAQKQAGEPRTPEQRLARAEQQFFYSKTRVLWQHNTTPDNRNDFIVNVMKDNQVILESGRRVQNFADAVKFIQERFSNEYPTMESVIANPNIGADFDNGIERATTSPDALNYTEWASLGVKL